MAAQRRVHQPDACIVTTSEAALKSVRCGGFFCATRTVDWLIAPTAAIHIDRFGPNRISDAKSITNDADTVARSSMVGRLSFSADEPMVATARPASTTSWPASGRRDNSTSSAMPVATTVPT